jgi:hypothetical protein
VTDAEVDFRFEILAGAPIERVEIRNRTALLEVWRPYTRRVLGRRIRVIWEGAEYRGRGRETMWRGSLALSGNTWSDARPVNRFNLDRRFDPTPHGLDFDGVTTGGFMGIEATLREARAGSLAIDTSLARGTLSLAELELDDWVLDAGGLGRRVRVFSLPDVNPHRHVSVSRRIRLQRDEDNALYVRATLEDGNVLWSSPIYLIAGDGRQSAG